MIRSVLTLALLGALSPSHAAPDLSTIAERSQFTHTGRYDEVIKLCAQFQRAYPKAAKCIDFGTTPEGRPMKALVVTRTGAMTAQAAAKRSLPVTLIQGGIHAGEIDGKDAGFLALREVLENKAAPGALDKQVVLFIPVFNIDGHERFKKWNRPNQRGPVETGWRATAQNFNLNRDYAKADSPEMQAMLALVNAWDPLTYIDLHVTNGAKFEHDVSIQVEPVHSADQALRASGRELRDNVLADLTRQGSMPHAFYMSFADTDNPASGFIDNVSDPRFSTGYIPLRNRLAMLVETHAWKDYPTRVRITRNTVVSVLSQVAEHGAKWQQAVAQADARAAKLGAATVPLSYKATDKARMIDFRGYAYSRTPSDVSGQLMTRYDETRPQIWTVPLRDEMVPDLQVKLPAAGYVVPAAYAAMVGTKLRQHGITFRVLEQGRDKADVETFRAQKVTLSPTSLESHQRVSVQGEWSAEPRPIPKGSLFVPIGQPKARLVAALLEPKAPDSMLAWGRFNTAFERKEYLEDYVAEDEARDMMARDPALAERFRQRLATDPAFAKDGAARLEFFARLHSSWDERLNLYPVMRTDVAL
ncbi:peptidase M14 [Massilia sp. PAMC28688]|uniref:M14 family zinc carboxypeptidase n=1 Tax=Massilia sp. PAMC28688 TaxID=2861283 RepID=UPI001C631DEE|nr:M14 family zinc carboxypeptidase [Massilia sp. PAMC28688]QYF94958.1 peptidase M14 [Massilia sp. PAMC28688]